MHKNDSQPNLLVVLTLRQSELADFESSLTQSLTNLRAEGSQFLHFYCVVQSESGKVTLPSTWTNDEKISVQVVAPQSVSASRNLGIEYAIERRATHILFHDASTVCTPSFVKAIRHHLSTSQNTLFLGRLVWTIENPSIISNPSGSESVKSPIELLAHTYVGAYLFETTNIGTLRFKAEVGPGSKSPIAAGEDVHFLSRYFQKNELKELTYYPHAIVTHPERPKDGSKQLTYAHGQGALYRYFLHKRLFSYGIGKYLALFAVNSALYLIPFRPQSFAIFRARVTGFFSNDYLRFL